MMAPNPRRKVSRSSTVIERSAGTVSSSGLSRLRSTRRSASSGSGRLDRIVERQDAVVDQRHGAGGADGLGERGDAEDGVAPQRRRIVERGVAEHLDVDVVAAARPARRDRAARPLSTWAASRSCRRPQAGGVEAPLTPSWRARSCVATLAVECAPWRPSKTSSGSRGSPRGDGGRAARQPHVVRGRQGLRLGTPVLQGGSQAFRRHGAAGRPDPGRAHGRPRRQGGRARHGRKGFFTISHFDGYAAVLVQLRPWPRSRCARRWRTPGWPVRHRGWPVPSSASA